MDSFLMHCSDFFIFFKQNITVKFELKIHVEVRVKSMHLCQATLY